MIKVLPALLIFLPSAGWSQTLSDASVASFGETRASWLAMNTIRPPAAAATLGAAHWNYLFDAMRARPEHEVDPASLRSANARLFRKTTAAPSGPPAQDGKGRMLIVPSPRDSALYQRTFRILLAHPDITDRYDEIILASADRFGLDPRLLKAIVSAESEFARSAVSPSGALGLMQVMPVTAEEVGILRSRLLDPEANIIAGAAYLHELFRLAWRRFKLKGRSFRQAPLWLVQRVIAAYNAGPRFLFRPAWYRQTRSYVRKVCLFYRSKVADLRGPPKAGGWIPPFKLLPPTGSPR